jgi:hypothetical protein
MAAAYRVPGASGWNKLNLALDQLAGKQSKAGWFETAKYEDGTPIAYVAAIQEFGAPEQGIPPRPFMRPAIEHNRQKWGKTAGQGAKAILRGLASAEQVMGALAAMAAGSIQQEIVAVASPPLKKATIAARRRRLSDKHTTGNLTKPLVDSGLMLASVTHVVEDAP